MNSHRLLVFLLAFVAAAFVHSSTLFSISTARKVISIDSQTGTISSLGTTIIPYVVWQSSSAVDDQANILYSVGYSLSGAYSLLGFNLRNNASLEIVLPLPFSKGSIINRVFWDLNKLTRELLITGPCPSDATANCLIKFSPQNRNWNPLFQIDDLGSTNSISLSVFTELSSSEVIVVDGDVNNQVLFVVNAINGESFKLPLSDIILYSLEYDSVSQNLFAIASKEQNGKFALYFVQIDSQTGTFSLISPIASYIDAFTQVATISPKDRRLYALLTNSTQPFPYTSYDLVTLDIDTGKLVSAVPAFCVASECPITIVAPF